MPSLVQQSYGKHRVRVSKIIRSKSGTSEESHELFEASVNIELQGDFSAAYLDGDNQLVVATDTCRNTVYVLAKDDPIDSLESFGCTIAKHFLTQYSHVNRATVSLKQRPWDRLLNSTHGFTGNDSQVPTCSVVATRNDGVIKIAVTAGVTNFVIAKTTQSGFSNFHRDEFRTLPDADDRILATSMTASWTYTSGPAIDYCKERQNIIASLMETFLNHYSRSVQETLFLMASAAIANSSLIENITLTMPNKHHIKFNLEPFGRQNDNDVFVVTDEPFGYITATVGR